MFSNEDINTDDSYMLRYGLLLAVLVVIKSIIVFLDDLLLNVPVNVGKLFLIKFVLLLLYLFLILTGLPIIIFFIRVF